MTLNPVSQDNGLPVNWADLTPEQKRRWRLDYFVNGTDIDFISPDAKKAYQIRAKRLADAYDIKEPDKIPINLPLGNLPCTLYGVNQRTIMYDYGQAAAACNAFNSKYGEELECSSSPMINPGKVAELVDYKLYSWPGRGLPLNAPGIQFVEGEYMKADEYDDLILDPSDFWLRIHLPRVLGTFAPFAHCQTITDFIEVLSLSQFASLGSPAMQESLLKLIEVGREHNKMTETLAAYPKTGPATGYPSMFAGIFAKAPFDTLGDTLRGTTNIMKDMYRRPDKVLAACDKIADVTIRSILRNPANKKRLIIQYPLHKGADGWMSQKQFDTFYWPSLKKVMNAFIHQGYIQVMFAEGSINSRLNSINEFPKGFVSWMFDQTDIFQAKKVLGDKCCIQGNVPSSLIVTGSAEDVKSLCRKLIENCGKGGGYILGAGAIAENPRLDNLRAMVSAVQEYGTKK
jgi:hypothetical protein